MSNQFAALLCFLVGVSSGVFLIWTFFRQNAMRKWPLIQGKVTDSRLNVVAGDSYEPYIRYSYLIQGQSYTNDKIAPISYTTEDKKSAERVIAPYIIGNSVAIYYDPKNPSRSVLQPRNSFLTHFFWVSFTALLIVVGFALLFQKD